MATDISITIRAKDEFSVVFRELEAAFQRAGSSGIPAGKAVLDLGTSLRGLAESAQVAESSVLEFAKESEERLDILAEQRRAKTEEQALLQEEAARNLGERLLALEEEISIRRENLHRRTSARVAQLQGEHLQQLLSQEKTYAEQSSALRSANLAGQIELYSAFSTAIKELAENQGKTLVRIAKALGIAEALVGAYVAANNALASAPYPFNIPLAALVLAQGLANVERIRQVNVAHGGIDHVPEDATFLLRQGERVLSPNQNRELTRFLAETEGQDGGGRVEIQNLTIHVLENATSAEALLSMDPSDLRVVITERIIPALDDLARLGIKPNFVESNT